MESYTRYSNFDTVGKLLMVNRYPNKSLIVDSADAKWTNFSWEVKAAAGLAAVPGRLYTTMPPIVVGLFVLSAPQPSIYGNIGYCPALILA